MLTLKNIQNYSFDENQYEIHETNYDEFCQMHDIKTIQNTIFIYTKYTRANSNQIDL